MLKKILTMILVPVMVTAVVAIGVFVVIQQKSTNQSFTEQRETVLQFAIDNVQLGLETGHVDAVKNTLNQLKTYTIFQGAVLFDAEMTPILAIPKEFEIMPSLVEEESVPSAWKVTRQQISFESGILRDQDGEVIGDLVIAFTREPITAANRRALIYSCVFGVLILLPLISIVVYSVTKMLKTVGEVKTVLQAVAGGDLDQRLDIESKDEFGEIAKAIDGAIAGMEEAFTKMKIASQAKSDFLANMSHELRTPLNAVIGFSEVLLQPVFGDLNENQASYVRDILDSGRHLLSLINDILDLSKIESGKMELDAEEVNLPKIVDDSFRMVRERAIKHQIELCQDTDQGLEWIHADERKLKQLLFNLISNAVKFTPDGGKVGIATEHRGDQVRITVWDTGVGIAEDEQDQIFDTFYQANSSLSKEQQGTGLGLSLVRRIAELHGGKVWLQSEEGQGSQFFVELPIKAIPLKEHELVEALSA